MCKKILIFGVGKKYCELKEYIDHENVIGFLDNKVEKEYTFLMEKLIYNPQRIPKDLQYDAVLIMSMYYYAIKSQLINLGIHKKNIYSLYQIGELQESTISDCEWRTITEWIKAPRRFLLIQHDGGGGGATIALTNLAMALSKKYSVLVTFSTKGETSSFYDENNIPYICNLQMNCDTEIFGKIISEADMILVNAIINNNIIELLHKKNKSFYIWLHDHSTTYERSDCELLRQCIDQNVKILAVSQKAVDVFTHYVKETEYRLFPLGIREYRYVRKSNKIIDEPTIVVIGNICSLKGQDILIEALDGVGNKCKLKLIGGIGPESEYVRQIIAECKKKCNYEYVGKMTNKEIHEMYLSGKIDVLICPSRFETMSIAVIEAMSYGVPVIVSDMTGIADYINKIESNCVFESENSKSLSKKIEWLLLNQENIKKVGEKMRYIYEQYFSMRQLGQRCKIFDK